MGRRRCAGQQPKRARQALAAVRLLAVKADRHTQTDGEGDVPLARRWGWGVTRAAAARATLPPGRCRPPHSWHAQLHAAAAARGAPSPCRRARSARWASWAACANPSSREQPAGSAPSRGDEDVPTLAQLRLEGKASEQACERQAATRAGAGVCECVCVWGGGGWRGAYPFNHESSPQLVHTKDTISGAKSASGAVRSPSQTPATLCRLQVCGQGRRFQWVAAAALRRPRLPGYVHPHPAQPAVCACAGPTMWSVHVAPPVDAGGREPVGGVAAPAHSSYAEHAGPPTRE